MITRAASTLALALALACTSKPHGHPSNTQGGPAEHTRRDLELTGEQERMLAALAERADANPRDFEALTASGYAHMNFALAGVLHLRDRAEQDLEAAFALDPTNERLNRTLGRFYNMRAVDGDWSKADMQVRVYHALLGDEDPLSMTNERFVASSFFMLGKILAAKNRGKNLEALRLVETLEDQLAARVAASPDDIELYALAGNFAFFFAGNIPLARERRVQEAVAYFEILRARWDELRPGAKDPEHCPNTYENFMFELAEGHLVLGHDAQAKAIYDELANTAAPGVPGPRTRAKELIAHVARDRLEHLSEYSGDMRLMPPWPSDVGNCVVCHAWNAEVPLDSLWSLAPIRAEDVPSQAHTKPIGAWLEPDTQPSKLPTIVERERLPAGIATLIERECSPCHFPGGEAFGQLDLSRADSIRAGAYWIRDRVSGGDMPPGGGLSGGDRAYVQGWVDALGE
jgi:tetratricopeptide (TPR) repeat protein